MSRILSRLYDVIITIQDCYTPSSVKSWELLSSLIIIKLPVKIYLMVRKVIWYVLVIVSFRDVKPDNILLDEQGKGVNCLVCVCMFVWPFKYLLQNLLNAYRTYGFTATDF